MQKKKLVLTDREASMFIGGCKSCGQPRAKQRVQNTVKCAPHEGHVNFECWCGIVY